MILCTLGSNRALPLFDNCRRGAVHNGLSATRHCSLMRVSHSNKISTVTNNRVYINKNIKILGVLTYEVLVFKGID